MKKLLLLSAFMPSMAFANDFTFQPYVGADFLHSVYSYNDNYDAGSGLFLDGDIILEDSLNGLNVHIGNRFHQNFGAELGYFRTQEESKDIATGTVVGPGTVAAADFTTDVQVSGFTVDALGYLPIGQQYPFELVGTAGVSYNTMEITDSSGSADVDESELGFRAGGGAQVNITPQINARALARYQTADFDDIAENAWTYSVGLNYGF